MRFWMLLLAACGGTGAIEVGDGVGSPEAPLWLADSGSPPPPPDPAVSVQEPDCEVLRGRTRCAYERRTLRTGSSLEANRDVLFQLPRGTPPDEGWPVALLFQGSYHPAVHFWDAEDDGSWGEVHQGEVVRALLSAGVAVLTPEARGGGLLYWDTNQPPWNMAWNTSPDAALMRTLLQALDDGDFGAIDAHRMLVGGLSSGGYMTSRLALEIPHRARAAVIVGASYATCAGALCVVGPVDEDHPPTLFLHGGADPIVPVSTMRPYARALRDAGVPVRVVVPPGLGHAWPARSADEVRAWVDAWL